MLPCRVILELQFATALKSHSYTSTKDNSHEITLLRQNRGRGPRVLRSHLPFHHHLRSRNLNTRNNSRRSEYSRKYSHSLPPHRPPRPPLPSLLHDSRFGPLPPSRTSTPEPQTTPSRQNR